MGWGRGKVKWDAGGDNGQELELGEGEKGEKGEDIHCAFAVLVAVVLVMVAPVFNEGKRATGTA